MQPFRDDRWLASANRSARLVETRCKCVRACTFTRHRDNARKGVERTGCRRGDQLEKEESSSKELPSHSLDLFYFLCPIPPLIRGDLLIQVSYFCLLVFLSATNFTLLHSLKYPQPITNLLR